ncbi:MAG: AlpA family phage regulatory protein [Candidatus Methanomethyliaceae archaeon]
MKFLRPHEVAHKMGLSKASLYRLVKGGMFPRPVKIFANVSVWLDSEVEQIMSAMYRNSPPDEIRELVRSIERSRTKGPDS